MRLEMLAPIVSTNPMTNPKMVTILSNVRAITCPSCRITQCGLRVQAMEEGMVVRYLSLTALNTLTSHYRLGYSAGFGSLSYLTPECT
jgi:hypothetical protein